MSKARVITINEIRPIGFRLNCKRFFWSITVQFRLTQTRYASFCFLLPPNMRASKEFGSLLNVLSEVTKIWPPTFSLTYSTPDRQVHCPSCITLLFESFFLLCQVGIVEFLKRKRLLLERRDRTCTRLNFTFH